MRSVNWSLVRELSARSSVADLVCAGKDTALAKVWVGIDAGKQAHHAAAIDEAGRVLWSVRVVNGQAALSELVARVPAEDEVCWAVDLIGCETALLRAVLIAVGQPVIYVPGRTVKAMAGGFPGEARCRAPGASACGRFCGGTGAGIGVRRRRRSTCTTRSPGRCAADRRFCCTTAIPKLHRAPGGQRWTHCRRSSAAFASVA